MSDRELKAFFLERVKAFQQLGGKYFFTEFFFLGKAEKEAQKNKIIAQNLKEMGEIKFQAREILNQFYNYGKIFKPIVEEIAKRTKRKDLQWLSWEEIKRVIEGKKVEKSNRDKSNWILTKKNTWDIIHEKHAEEIKNAFEIQFFKIDLNELRGMCANKGVYQGKAKILRTVFSDNVEKEIAKVQEGDVLVANTTGPEIMAACMRAGAIITDEGGLTSHAAIVSRELGIPCVVGCKVATKVFKDNDCIEIDAEKGMARKI